VRLLKAEAEEEWHRHSVDFWRSLGPAMSVSNITHAMALVSEMLPQASTHRDPASGQHTF
jgi:hypothetical protein